MAETAIQFSLMLQDENKMIQTEHGALKNKTHYFEMEVKEFNLKFHGFPKQMEKDTGIEFWLTCWLAGWLGELDLVEEIAPSVAKAYRLGLPINKKRP